MYLREDDQVKPKEFSNMPETPAEQAKALLMQRLEADFVPAGSFTSDAKGEEKRIAWAAEYSAFQLGKINQSLKSIAESLKLLTTR
ncbi:MAG: hypothetical protein C0519_00540 [Hyphomicrobium sp.]|nr:hypothetical protein [Hyphomicrobium sp.]PPD08024.1 MAG: hypothetical protein CTY28_07020 [Hyphomicrobium sp.]